MTVALRPVPDPSPRLPPSAPSTPPDPPETIRVVAWPDPVIDRLGYDPRSLYVETFWLGVLGPTSTWLIRRFAAGLDDDPSGFDLPLEDTARALGLGGRSGRHAPFRRALLRCVTFEVAKPLGPTTLAVRRKVPPLPRRHLQRLPLSLQQRHERWIALARRSPALDDVRRRARRLALGLLDSGEAAPAAELQLLRWKVHPALAHEATQWASTHLLATVPTVPAVPGAAGGPTAARHPAHEEAGEHEEGAAGHAR